MSVFDKDTEKMLVQKRLIIAEYVEAMGEDAPEDFDMEDVVEWQAQQRAEKTPCIKSATPEEDLIWQLIVDANQKFSQLNKEHPDEMNTWIMGIHNLQSVLGWRILRRDHPADFPKKFTKSSSKGRKIGE